MSEFDRKHETSPWVEAIGLVHRWLEKSERIDDLMENAQADLSSIERARVQHLVFGAVRHHLRLQKILERRLAHPPRHRVLAILYVAGFELVDAYAGADPEGQVAKVVHHAVEQSKRLIAPAELKLVNAVLRRVAEEIGFEKVPGALAPAHVLAAHYSHPEWMVKRWFALFGAKPTRQFLEWNLTPSPVYARWRGPSDAEKPSFLKETNWPGFFLVEAGHWRDAAPLLAAGTLYIQDPSTRLAIDLLAPQPGETVIDLCAAPGGKSIACADRMNGSGMIIAVDLPGLRQDRLEENLARITGVRTRRMGADVTSELTLALNSNGLPQQYDAILLDVPCSNTGVMRHRIDVKERLDEDDLPRHAEQQFRMLLTAARLLSPKGRLVYSTCSIEPDENAHVVKRFLDASKGAFVLESSISATPWEHGHDGAGAFLLRRA